MLVLKYFVVQRFTDLGITQKKFLDSFTWNLFWCRQNPRVNHRIYLTSPQRPDQQLETKRDEYYVSIILITTVFVLPHVAYNLNILSRKVLFHFYGTKIDVLGFAFEVHAEKCWHSWELNFELLVPRLKIILPVFTDPPLMQINVIV